MAAPGRSVDVPRATIRDARTMSAMFALRHLPHPLHRHLLRQPLPWSCPRLAPTIDVVVATRRSVSRSTVRATADTAERPAMPARIVRIATTVTTTVETGPIRATGTSEVRRSVLYLSSELKPEGGAPERQP